jgi:guanylate kinase
MSSRTIIIGGARGAGKGLYVSMLQAMFPQLRRIVSHTTRRPRPGEVNGTHYWFVFPEAFDAIQNSNGFLYARDIGSEQRSGISRHEVFQDGDGILDITGPVAKKLRDRIEKLRAGSTLTIYVHAPPALRAKRMRARDPGTTNTIVEQMLTDDPDSGDIRDFEDFDIIIFNHGTTLREAEAALMQNIEKIRFFLS